MNKCREVALLLVVFIIFIAGAGCQASAPAGADYAVRPVPLAQVDVKDGFWAPRQEVNRRVSIWHCFKKFEEAGDFDSPKLIEAAAYMLARRPDPALEGHVDAEVEKLVASLEPRAADPERAVRVSGHFYEAAVAYAQATGKRRMLEAAVKIADEAASAYGPGKKTYISGHEGQKIGLVGLFRATGDDRYLRLARFFLDERGREDYPRRGEYALDRTYAQDHKPVIEQDEAVGHAVRAMFLYIALTDIAALSGDVRYLQALDRIWADAVSRKTYLTGGIGSIRFHEQFGAAYELPNLSAWNETCAAYGSVVWNHRLFLLHRDAKYLDLLERVLYNGFLVGVGLSGDRFFYQNPLLSYGDYERFDWINVPCCPPNVVRLIAQLGSFIYAQDDEGLYVNLFIGSEASVEIGKTSVKIAQETRYPWDGAARILVEPARPARFALRIRIPGWTGNDLWAGRLYEFMDSPEAFKSAPKLTLNGRTVEAEVEKGFAEIDRTWRPGDTVEVDLPMPVRRIRADPRVRDDEGRVALQCGPLVYCVEGPDNDGHALNIVVPDEAGLESGFRPNLLGGVRTVTGKVLAVRRSAEGSSLETVPHELVAIPYFAWANRGREEMAVWIPRRAAEAWTLPVPPPPVVRVTAQGGIRKMWTGYNDQSDDLSAVYDGRDPLNSADESHRYYRLRPAEGSPAWVEMEFSGPTTISSTSVYWVDDRRFCRPPESWRVLVLDGGSWKPVAAGDPYGVAKDRFNTVAFAPVTTKAVRLEVEPRKIPYRAGDIGPPDALFLSKDITWRECGIIEWRVK